MIDARMLIGDVSTLGEIIERNERRFPDALCLVFDDQRFSFGQYAERVRRLADGLHKLGLNRQDRVSIVSTNRAECFELYGACEWAGYVCAPISNALAPPEIHRIIENAGPRIIVFEEPFADTLKTIRDSTENVTEFVCLSATCPSWAIPYSELVSKGNPAGPSFRAKPEDYLSLFYTSGTTGRQKGVVLSHLQQITSGLGTASEAELKVGDVALLSMPCSHLAASTHRVALQLSAGAVVIARRSDPTNMLQLIDRERVSFVGVTPTLLQMILDVPNLATYDLSSLKTILYSSAPMPVALLEEGLRRLGPVFVSYFGQTEGGATSLLRHHHRLDGTAKDIERLKSVGLPRPGTRLRIVDDSDQELSPERIGEICLQSDSVMVGYWNDPEATAETLRNGWLHTGDLGYLDQEGFLFLVDRKKDMIIAGGNNIYSKEVEDALCLHPAVAEAAVIGIPNPLWGEVVRAIVVTKKGVHTTESEIIAACRTRLALYKCPASVVFLDGLPKLPTGKVYKPSLRERFGKPLIHPQSSNVEPHTKVEGILLQLWRDVLNRQDIGCDDDFFLFGGDSISAANLILLIEEELQYQLPLNILTEAPTVGLLAMRLETNTFGIVSDTISIHPSGGRRPLFAVHGLGGIGLLLIPVLRSLGPDQPCYGLQPPGMDWAVAGCVTLSQIAAHYIGVIRTVQPRGPYRLLGVSFGGLVVFEMALQLQRDREQVEFLGMVDTYPPTPQFEATLDDTPNEIINRLQFRQINSIEVQTRRVIETHSRAQSSYVLDDRSDENIFRGELVYFYCSGSPVLASQERRKIWQEFASSIRLLKLPGRHGMQHQEPQCSALGNLLQSCLNGTPPRGIDPQDLYSRDYRVETFNDREHIVSSAGDVYPIEEDHTLGHLDEIRMDTASINITGWAVEPENRRQPAQTIAVFVGGRFLGYGAAADTRPDVGAQLVTPLAFHAGFNFSFPRSVASFERGKPRLFVLSIDGRAVELRDSIEPVTLGSTKGLSGAEPLGVIMGGNWCLVREEWGIWSDGPHAEVMFDASVLPDRFTVHIEAILFPPGPSPAQRIRISDISGKLLRTISNKQPSGKFAVVMDQSKSRFRGLTSLIFDIDHPMSPRDLGMNGDFRELGIGLQSLAFQRTPNVFSRSVSTAVSRLRLSIASLWS